MQEQKILFAAVIASLVILITISVHYDILQYVGAALLGVMLSMHLFFLIGVLTKNHTFVDTAWGLSFIIVAHTTFWMHPAHTPVQWLVLAMVTLWGLRLFTHIARRTFGRKEDLRYQAMRKSMEKKKRALLASYLKIYIFQGFLALLIAAPLILINALTTSCLASWYPVGVAVWLLGFAFEVISDRQLQSFLADQHNQGRLMTGGLWQYSRHPNYFGEAVLWWGIFLIALTFTGGWTSIFGPALLTFLLLKISGIPPAERLMRNLPGFDAYKRRTNAFIPWFPKKD